MLYKIPGIWQVLSRPLQRQTSLRFSSESAIPRRKVKDHIYKKTYTKEELIEYLKKNVSYECDRYIVTSVPQGIGFSKNNNWIDYDKPPICNVNLQEMIPDLSRAFNSKTIFVAKHPRRTSSGVTILAKDFNSVQSVRRCFGEAEATFEKIFTYLLLVLGHPEELSKTFVLWHDSVDTGKLLQIYDESKKIKMSTKVKYQHSVLASTEHVSLVKVTASSDRKDCIRHILAQRCLTPIFGDFWNFKASQNTIFGAPLLTDHTIQQNICYSIQPELQEKLQVTSGEEIFTPIHSHLYSLRLRLKSREELFVSVPPPESFIWTCHQLGLNEINEFTKTMADAS